MKARINKQVIGAVPAGGVCDGQGKWHAIITSIPRVASNTGSEQLALMRADDETRGEGAHSSPGFAT